MVAPFIDIKMLANLTDVGKSAKNGSWRTLLWYDYDDLKRIRRISAWRLRTGSTATSANSRDGSLGYGCC